VETGPAQPPPSTSATAAGPPPRHGDTDEGWKKVEEEAGAEELGIEAEELQLFLPTPSLMVSAGKREN